MKNMKNIFYLAVLVLCATGLFSSCSDDDYDVKGFTYERVYLVNNEASYKIVQISGGTISSVSYSTSVNLTGAVKSDITVSLGVDNSMVAEYNEANGTTYEEIPNNAVVFTPATLTIPSGAMVSSEECTLTLTEDATVLSTLTSENGYLIPLRIKEVKGGNAKTSSDVYYTYIIVTVTEDNVNHDASESDITGTKVEDQSGWTATLTGGTVNTGSRYSELSAIFDGSVGTYSYITLSTDCNLDVDMGKQYTFDGIYMAYSTNNGNSVTSSFSIGMTIYTSDDGSTWTKAGETTKASTFVAFYGPLTARYIRITKPYSTSSRTWYIGSFNVYAK